MHWGRILFLGGLLVLALSRHVVAEPPPSYLLLRTPPAPGGHHPRYSAYPGQPREVHTKSYSYGWFGAQPRRQWSRQSGYYRNYRQWSGR